MPFSLKCLGTAGVASLLVFAGASAFAQAKKPPPPAADQAAPTPPPAADQAAPTPPPPATDQAGTHTPPAADQAAPTPPPPATDQAGTHTPLANSTKTEKPNPNAEVISSAPLIPAAGLLLSMIIGGILGMVGQGARAAIGLKGLHDQAEIHNVSMWDLFEAARFAISLGIGFVAGIMSTLAIGFNKLLSVGPSNIDVLLSIIAAGYAGTDFIEGFMARYPPSTMPKAKSRDEAAPDRQPRSGRSDPDRTAPPDAGTASDAGDAGQLAAATALAAFAVREGAFEPHEWANDSTDPQRGVM